MSTIRQKKNRLFYKKLLMSFRKTTKMTKKSISLCRKFCMKRIKVVKKILVAERKRFSRAFSFTKLLQGKQSRSRRGKTAYVGYPKIFLKTSSVLLITLLWASLLGVNDTRSYYNDNEESSGNTFLAGALDFILTNGDFVQKEASLNFQPATTTSKTVGMALLPNSNPMKYTASTTNVFGDLPFCQSIDLHATLASTSQFSGKLTEFVSGATTTIGNWQYDFSYGSSTASYNSICAFDFSYNGRQTAPHNEYSVGGYDDTETVQSTLYSWGFRINKVYYDVDTLHGNEGENEWVEIYNQTDSALDISGWQICDDTSCDVIPASTTPIMVPAKGFAVITASSTTWKYWDIPNDVVKIELGNDIGDGLSNDGDKLTLKRPDGAVMDEMNWQTNTEVWNPGATDVPEGHMLGRKPNGYDTNQPSDFVDLAVPSVLLINPNQSGSQVWYWTYLYNITWNATNPNGPDSDITINLSYIKDTDHSGTITPSDETVIIATNLANSGSYSWHLPSGFLGYIWVKIVAVGPENPMLNARMISGKVWDPFPLETSVSTDSGLLMGDMLEALIPDASVVASSDQVEVSVVVEEIIDETAPKVEENIVVVPHSEEATGNGKTSTTVSGGSTVPEANVNAVSGTVLETVTGATETDAAPKPVGSESVVEPEVKGGAVLDVVPETGTEVPEVVNVSVGVSPAPASVPEPTSESTTTSEPALSSEPELISVPESAPVLAPEAVPEPTPILAPEAAPVSEPTPSPAPAAEPVAS